MQTLVLTPACVISIGWPSWFKTELFLTLRRNPPPPPYRKCTEPWHHCVVSNRTMNFVNCYTPNIYIYIYIYMGLCLLMWRWFLYCCRKHCNPGVHCIFLCKWWNWLSQPFSRCLGLCVVCAAVACGLIFISSSCKEVNVWFCLCENLNVCITSTCHYSTLGLLSFAFLLWFDDSLICGSELNLFKESK